MTMHDAHNHEGQGPPRRSPSWIVRLLMFVLLGVGAYYIIAEHGAHVLAAWPLIFLLACPLMHLLHGGHGSHHGQHRSDDRAGDANG